MDLAEFGSFEWLLFPKDVAALIAQIAPVIFLALVLELRAYRQRASTRSENKGLLKHINRAFASFLGAEYITLTVVARDGISGLEALLYWLAVALCLGIDMVTLLHAVREDE